MGSCDICGSEFEQHAGRGRKRHYCSPACKSRAQRKRERELIQAARQLARRKS